MESRKTRIPYGYRIEDGKAVIDPEKSGILKRFFRYFLEGEPMAAAASAAGLPCSRATYPHLFSRKEYLGDHYYPQMIEESYQKELIAEWMRRKRDYKGKKRTPAQQAVKIYTAFRMDPPPRLGSKDPKIQAQELYRCVKPVEKT